MWHILLILITYAASSSLLSINGVYPNGPNIDVVGQGNMQIINATIATKSALTNLTNVLISGATTLGTMVCGNPISQTCYNIGSSNVCTSSPLSANCMPSSLSFTSLMVTNLTTNSIINYQLVNQTNLNVNTLNTNSTYFGSSTLCTNGAYISNNCFTFGGSTCSSPVSGACIPMSENFANITVTGTLNINNLVCSAAISSSCIPSRVRTINGIGPTTAVTLLGLNGITFSAIANGITVSATNFLSTYNGAFTLLGSSVTTLNFIGNGVSANATNVYVPGTISLDLQSEGVTVSSPQTTLNFNDTGVSVTSVDATTVNVSIPYPTKFMIQAIIGADPINITAGSNVSMNNIISDTGVISIASYWDGNTFSPPYDCLYWIGVSYVGNGTGTFSINGNQTNSSFVLGNYVSNLEGDNTFPFVGGNSYVGQTVGTGIIGTLSIARNMMYGEHWKFYNAGGSTWSPNFSVSGSNLISISCLV